MVSLQPFPWREAIGFGLGVLRLAPDQFWAHDAARARLCDRGGDRTRRRAAAARDAQPIDEEVPRWPTN